VSEPPPAADDALYRPNVGIMLVNPARLVFVARRIDTPVDAWQMPQGGIDEGEEPRAAALRELEEEIGTAKAEIVAESRSWLRYDLPAELQGKLWKGRWKGQRQKWFLMRFTGRDEDIDLATAHPEFDAWRWVEPNQVPEQIVPFKRDTYRAVLAEFAPVLERWRR
jgi:putative (di)nucleoside polyphosphate hydrolase